MSTAWFREGRDARHAGKPREECPYGKTWQKVRRRAWLGGWDSVDREAPGDKPFVDDAPRPDSLVGKQYIGRVLRGKDGEPPRLVDLTPVEPPKKPAKAARKPVERVQPPEAPPEPGTPVERVFACLEGPRFAMHVKRQRERGMSLWEAKDHLTRIALKQAIEVAETPADFRLVMGRMLDHFTHA